MHFKKNVCVSVQTGFGLVELMVAMVLGLVVTLAISQVFLGFDLQKRTTGGGADAQTNGTVSLYLISRDLQMAGYGLLPADNSAVECNPSPSIDGIDLSPVVITDGAGPAGSDTIAIRYGDSPTGGAQLAISGAPVGFNVTVANNLGCRHNDVALLINGALCALTRVNGVAATGAPTSGAANTTVTLADVTGAVGGGSLVCLGAWQQRVYDVTGGLRVNGAVIVNDVVNVQAQYGVSAAANSNQILQWVDATGGWATPSVADRNRIKAVRIAVVTRSGNLERENVTEACSSTEEANPTGLCAWDATSAAPGVASPAPAIDLSGDDNWQRYRYRVFETIVPLRNPIWSREDL